MNNSVLDEGFVRCAIYSAWGPVFKQGKHRIWRSCSFREQHLTFIFKILRGLRRKPVGDQLCCTTRAPVTQGAAVASEKCFSVFSEEWQSMCLALHIERSFSEDFTAIYFRLSTN